MGGRNNLTNKKAKSSPEDKINWLIGHRDLWYHDYKERAINKEVLIGCMKLDGLVASSTFWRDVKVGRHLDAAFNKIEVPW